jgi:uncharacterized protein (DUF1800 family)
MVTTHAGSVLRAVAAAALAHAFVAPFALAARQSHAPAERAAIVFDARAAEHLLARASFGATPEEIEAAVAAGLDATVDALLVASGVADAPAAPAAFARTPPYFAEKLSPRDIAKGGLLGVGLRDGREAAKDEAKKMIARDRLQLLDYTNWWVGRMVSGEAALRERMTLFWSDHFTSSMSDVKSSYQMIRQNQLLREYALESFTDLLRGIARDPAMLEYLDNDANRKGEPNENFARELMELFTLGIGNYTERDVQEVARAFTGWSSEQGEFEFQKRRHDEGPKTVLGVTGDLDGDDVLAILLEQPACAPFVAGKLLCWLEGTEPEPARLASYADAFRASGYNVAALLRRLFTDPDFYREEIRGARIAGPIDYLVGAARRLHGEPPPVMIAVGARILGQQLFHPPNVKGWEEGEAWITTSSFMQRGNLAGLMLGVVRAEDVLEGTAFEADTAGSGAGMEPDMDPGMAPGAEETEDRDRAPAAELRKLKDEPYEALKKLESLGWRPRIDLCGRYGGRGLATTGEVAAAMLEDLLAVPPSAELGERMTGFLGEECRMRGVADGQLFADPQACEAALRALAHVILSLPEAQLH